MITNPDVVVCARGWLGTRFHHQGRLKKTVTHKGGVDCLGLLVGIACELDLRAADNTLLADFDRADYTHLPDTERLQQTLSSLLVAIPMGGIAPGTILLLNIDGRPQHMGIVSDLGRGLGLIHAYAPARAVVEHVLDTIWHERIVAAYSLS
jgi:hypothetical protein